MNVDKHDVHRTGHHGKLLLKEVAGDGYPVTHQHFIGRATQPHQVDTLGTLGFGFGQEFRVACGGHDYIGQRRLMAVDNDVHLVGF